MCTMIKQMDLVLKAVEDTSTTEDAKDIAISLMADIVSWGCRNCVQEECVKAEPVHAAVALSASDSSLLLAQS